jgi:hypothetical protein
MVWGVHSTTQPILAMPAGQTPAGVHLCLHTPGSDLWIDSSRQP